MLKVFKGAWPSEEDQFEWFGVIWPDEAKIRCHYPRSLWSKRNTGDTIRYLFQVNPTLVTSRHHSPRGANANTRQGTNCQGLCPCWEGRKGCYLFVWTIHEINMNRVSNFEPSHSQRMKTKITWTLKSWLVDRIPHLKSKNRPTTTFKWSEQKYIWDITPKKVKVVGSHGNWYPGLVSHVEKPLFKQKKPMARRHPPQKDTYFSSSNWFDSQRQTVSFHGMAYVSLMTIFSGAI